MVDKFDEDGDMLEYDQESVWKALDELMPLPDREDSSDMFEVLEQDFGFTSIMAEHIVNDYLDWYYDELISKHEDEIE